MTTFPAISLILSNPDLMESLKDFLVGITVVGASVVGGGWRKV